MKNIIIIIFALIIALGFSSCESFLDKDPSTQSNKPIETTEDLNLILNNNIDFVGERNFASMCATDNSAVDTFHYKFQPRVFTNQNALGWFLWDDFIQKNAVRHEDWAKEFAKIGKANLILDFVDNVKGSAEEKEELKKEARFARGYSYFNLVTVYCITYSEANLNELGLPLKRSISVEEPVKRATLKQTFDFIEADIEAALKAEMIDRNPRPWRYSLPAVHAFAARFYLYKGDYDKALEYANKALEKHDELVSFETVMYNNGELFNWGNKGALYPQSRTMTAEDVYRWAENYYLRLIGQRAYYLHSYPSQRLISLYDPKDIRFDALFVEDVVVGTSQSPYTGYFYMGSTNSIPSGPTTAEMYLIRAECYARKADVGGVESNVEQLRKSRFKAADYQALEYPANPKSLIELVMDERSREFPFTLRWYDLHRINRDPLLDPVTITRQFYEMDGNIPLVDGSLKTYTLEPGRRYAMPITESEIITSGEVIEQNTY